MPGTASYPSAPSLRCWTLGVNLWVSCALVLPCLMHVCRLVRGASRMCTDHLSVWTVAYCVYHAHVSVDTMCACYYVRILHWVHTSLHTCVCVCTPCHCMHVHLLAHEHVCRASVHRCAWSCVCVPGLCAVPAGHLCVGAPVLCPRPRSKPLAQPAHKGVSSKDLGRLGLRGLIGP